MRGISRQSVARLGMLPLALALLLALSMNSAVMASSVHLKGGANAAPAFTDNGLTLTASGALSGLGFGDVVINVSATANPTAVCSNNGGNAAPGQNPAPVTVTGSVGIPASAIKNGNAPFSLTTTPPVTPIARAPDCPNTNWVENITDMAFTSATYTVFQPNLVLTVSCVFKSPTTNGAVPTSNVNCTSK